MFGTNMKQPKNWMLIWWIVHHSGFLAGDMSETSELPISNPCHLIDFVWFCDHLRWTIRTSIWCWSETTSIPIKHGKRPFLCRGIGTSPEGCLRSTQVSGWPFNPEGCTWSKWSCFSGARAELFGTPALLVFIQYVFFSFLTASRRLCRSIVAPTIEYQQTSAQKNWPGGAGAICRRCFSARSFA